MTIRGVIEAKKQWRAQWRAHTARVEALPPDYQVVYREIQKYCLRVGAAGCPDGRQLSGILDFFEEGAAAGRGVLELTGSDVAAFCDDLIKDSR